MNTIDFTKTGGMPIDQSTLDFMQSGYNLLLTQLGNVLGEYIILNGSQELGGWVSIKGEIMPFDRGFGDNCCIIETKGKVVYQDGESKKVYTTQKLVFDTGTPQLKWSNFQKIDTLIDLQKRVHTLYSRIIPTGTIQLFAGNNMPEGWSSCRGQSLLKSQYPKLWEVLKSEYPYDKNKFLLPDLRGRFVVGQDPQRYDYDNVGQKGGIDKVTLTENQMPKHSHKFSMYNGYEDLRYGTANSPTKVVIHNPSSMYAGETDEVGSNQPHENRPPYYVVQYIIFLH